jgi:hypothetical protein
MAIAVALAVMGLVVPAVAAVRADRSSSVAVVSGPGTSGTASCQPRAVPVCVADPPVVDEVTAGAAPTRDFDRYAATTARGWTGGDSTYSVSLPDGRIVWLFSDTFLGPLRADGTRPTTSTLVNNSFVVQDGAGLTTVHGGTADRPAAVMPPAGPDRWFWTGDGLVTADGDLQVVYREYERTAAGQWTFAFTRSVVATFAPTDLTRPAAVDPLPSAGVVAWGAAVLPGDRSGDGYTYVYGTAAGGKSMRIARVPGTDLRAGPWRFYADCGWSPDDRASVDVLPGVADEYSVTAQGGRYLLVATEGANLDPRIFGRRGCTPYGPFGARTELYRMPEPGAGGSYHDRDVVGYNAHAHPGVGPGDAVLVSYNVTSVETTIGPGADLYRDPSIYRPRFIEVRLRPDPTDGG